MIRNTITLTLLLFCIHLCQAQFTSYTWDSDSLDANDMNVLFNSGGDVGWDLIGEPHFEVPKGSGKNALFAANLWLGGVDVRGQMRIAGQTYRQVGIDFWPGPTANSYDSAYVARYRKVWKVSKTEIDRHALLYNQPGYTAPSSILDWPGNGDISNGEPLQLAPFVDQNSNGLYEPQSGDYPDVPGDQAVFLIYSDNPIPNTELGGKQTGIEVHMTGYVFDADSGDVLDQTLFIHHRIINRLGTDYREFRVGLWADYDLGFFRDDYVGCDTTLDAFFCYNSDNNDEGNSGYGVRPPAIGHVLLNQKLDYFRTVPQNPATPSDYYLTLQNIWPNGTQVTIGGDGMSGTVPTRYMYSGDPTDNSQWSQVNTNTGPFDNKVVGSIGPYPLAHNEEICLETAIVFGRSPVGDHSSSLRFLKNRMREIRDFYDSTQLICQSPSTTHMAELPDEPLAYSLFPNPSSGQLFLNWDMQTAEIRFFDMQGKLMLESDIKAGESHKWDISHWSPGLYMVQFRTHSKSWSHKLIKK